MRNIYTYLVFMCGMLLYACSEDEVALELSLNEVYLDAAGRETEILVTTDEPTWQVVGNTGWIIVDRDSCRLKVSAASNPTRSERKLKLIIKAGDKLFWLPVTQAGSSRAVGELYPDTQNPVGMIYSVLDGGKHGKVVSLDEYVWGEDGVFGMWGTNNQVNDNARSFTDGKSNTRNMIVTHKDESSFRIGYRVFSWVYEKNNENIDGEWYIPAAYELDELYYTLTGNLYVEPSSVGTSISQNPVVYHDFATRDRFDYILKGCGGTPFTYGNYNYWSSTEYSPTAAWAVSFRDGGGSIGTLIKRSAAWHARAILEF